MIAAGTRVTINVQGQTSAWLPLTEANLRDGVIDGLSHTFTVNSVGITPLGSVYVGLQDWPYSARVNVTTRVSYAKAEDVASIVANAFYQAGGSLPTVNAEGYGPRQDVAVMPEPSTGPGLGFGLWTFGIVAIAVAVFVFKRG